LQDGESGHPQVDLFVNEIMSLNARELTENPLEHISIGGQAYRRDYTRSEGQRLTKRWELERIKNIAIHALRAWLALKRSSLVEKQRP
jgi:hypothetical protein